MPTILRRTEQAHHLGRSIPREQSFTDVAEYEKSFSYDPEIEQTHPEKLDYNVYGAGAVTRRRRGGWDGPRDRQAWLSEGLGGSCRDRNGRVFVYRDRECRDDRDTDGRHAELARLDRLVPRSVPQARDGSGCRPPATRERARQRLPQGSAQPMGPVAVRGIAARGRGTHDPARFWLQPRCVAEQHRDPEGRPVQDRRPHRQPRPSRPLRRPQRVPGQVPRIPARGSDALCRRRGQFLSPRQPEQGAGAVHGFRPARPA